MTGLSPGEILALLGVLAGLALWIWALVDCALRCPRERRVTWVVIIALFNAAGALLYLVLRQGLLSRRRGEDAS